MAKKFDLTLELARGFHSFFEDHKDNEEYRFLLNRMNALEVRAFHSAPFSAAALIELTRLAWGA
jgi:hypothetical protein